VIICTVCGNHNEDGDAFCGSCGEYLEWEGRRLGDLAPSEPQLEEPTSDAGKRLIERVVDRLAGSSESVRSATTETPSDGSTIGVSIGATPTVDDEAASLARAAEGRAQRLAEEAERARVEAVERARQDAEAAEQARHQAEEAERARVRAQELAATESAEAERLRAELEAAERSRQQAEEELQRERDVLARVRTETDEAEQAAVTEAQQQAQAAERARREAEERLEAERQAVAQARAEVEAAEAARVAAEERARQEVEAAEAAARKAAAADEARAAAELKAAEEAAAAERARRAAALVAKPKPAPAPQPPAKTPARKPTAENPAAAEGAEATKPRAPKAVKPTQTRDRPAPRRDLGPSRTIRPGDLICGECGEGNTPDRNFCRRCGNSLKEAEVVPTPWWRRLVPRRRRYAAGERPRRLQGRGRQGGGVVAKGREGKRKFHRVVGIVARVTAVVAVLGVGGLSLGPWRSTVTDWLGDRFESVRRVVAPQYDTITATGLETFSSQRDDHPAAHAIDLRSNTWWAANGGGTGEFLIIGFAQPVDLALMGLTSGAADQNEFAAQPRPAAIHLVFDNGNAMDVTVADGRQFQTFEIVGGEGVSRVEVRITEVYPGQSGNDLSITEIEFRTKR
jgi:hypothetical protein